MTEPRSFPQTFHEPPDGACRVLLVRHGQSIPYVSGQPFPLVDGHGDPPLSPRGEWQAIQVGERLRTEPITAIYASTLQRTQQTATPLSDHLGLPIQIEPDVREVFLGEMEGGLFRELAADGHPAAIAMRTNRNWGEVPGAETNEELQSRTVAAVTRIAMHHPNEMVAVFCHGGVIGSLLSYAVGQTGWTFRGARNASISHLYVSDDEWLIMAHNVADHIGAFTHDLDPS